MLKGDIKRTEEPHPRGEGWPPRTVTHVLCCRKTWLRCEGMTTTCDHCGADYNWHGARLAPREQWDWEER